MKIEIDIRDNIDEVTAVKCVLEVVKQGRISKNGKMFCYATVLDTKYGEVAVVARDYRKNDCFMVCKHNPKQ